ncbi:MAG: ComF family protein, partial [Gemmatimonadota bacterium]
MAETIVHGLKYGGWRHLAILCAEPMASRLLRQTTLPDALVAVPLHSTRLRARGYNQAALIAEALAQRCGRPAVTALARVSATRSQVGLSRSARSANVAGVFL